MMMKMMNAHTNRDEDNNSGGWKQVRSGKATGTGSAHVGTVKTFYYQIYNDNEDDECKYKQR
jgi:hypothetical protein